MTWQKSEDFLFYRWLSCIVLFAMLFLQHLPGEARAQDEKNMDPSPRKEKILINTYAKVLDRDGKKQVVTNIFDSYETDAFIVCSGTEGQSPIYRVPKKDVLAMELDGITTNMSGWDYAGCELLLKGDRRLKGYITVFHMGLNEYRTFQGKSEYGTYMISWKRLKKIEFLGNWVEAPPKKEK
jgi:hypothetical protein